MLHYVSPRSVFLVAFLLFYALVWVREFTIGTRDS
jgi:hypothetical protein